MQQILGSDNLAVIKVVGVGGGGTNAVNRMVEAGIKGVEFIAVNTDRQALMLSDADKQFILAKRLLVALVRVLTQRLAARRLKSLVLRFVKLLLMLIWFLLLQVKAAVPVRVQLP